MFGFLKEKLKQTVERFTKKVDEATEVVEPSEKLKKELLNEKPIKKKIVSKKFVDEKYGLEISEKEETVEKKEEKKHEKQKEEKKKDKKKKEYTVEKKEEKKKEGKKKEQIFEKKEEKGFFARLKEKFVHTEEQDIEEDIKEAEKLEHEAEQEEEKEEKEKKEEEKKEEEKKEEEKKEDAFHASTEELKELEHSFKAAEPLVVEEDKKEELIPVVIQTDTGETLFEMQEKPTAIKQKPIKEEKKKQEPLVPVKEEKGFFGVLKDTIFKTSLSEEKFEEIFWELEVILLENNVAVEVIELIKKNLKKELVETKVLRGEIQDIITETLRTSIEETFTVAPVDIIEAIKEKKPYVIVFVGINGSGKTTTIAKIAQKLKDNHLTCVMAAGDTFRAAAIQQLEEHATHLKIKLIKHDYGSDPAAVGFDAIKYAKAHHIDCVLIDTAGRLHSNTNLVDEMKKIIRVTKPDLKLFIGEAITGNDCVEQARKFDEAIGIDGIILAKADVDEKGGAALSISYVTGKPILYLGVGQGYGDLVEFDSEKIIGQLGLG